MVLKLRSFCRKEHEAESTNAKNSMRHTRLYATPDGESHFADSEIEFEPIDYVANAVPLGLSQPMNASEVRFMEAPTDWSSDWHPSLGRNMFFVLSGKWEVTASDG